MKKLCIFLLIMILLCCGCSRHTGNYDIAVTTLPVYEFTTSICSGTDLRIGRVVTENVSCLHDYTLQVSQMRMIESADVLIISGAGFEGFLTDVIDMADAVIDSSANITLIDAMDGHHHEHTEHHEHSHDQDPHIWLSPENAKIMAENICRDLSERYPQYNSCFEKNLSVLCDELDRLQIYGENSLSSLKTSELITFHDGFGYLAESFGLTVLEAVEEESGSEPSAQEIIHLIQIVKEHELPAIFTEVNGSNACAGIIQAETGTNVYELDMVISGDSYFDAMYHNINTLKEALG